MSDLFICYSSKDEELANRICIGLEKRGVRCWIATKDILPGETWAGAITDGILTSTHFLLLLSSHSNESIEVAREIDLAASNQKTLYYFRLENIKPRNNLAFYLSNIQWLDAFDRPLEEILDQFINRLLTSETPDTIPDSDKASLSARIRIAELEAAILKAIEVCEPENSVLANQLRDALGKSPENSHEIFISYSEEKAEYAAAICKGLGDQGLTCWIADRDLTRDSNWVNEIHNAIGNAKAFIFILSQGAEKSKQILYEINQAERRKIPIFCVRSDDIPMPKILQFSFDSIQYWDAFGYPNESFIRKMALYLRQVIKKRS